MKVSATLVLFFAGLLTIAIVHTLATSFYLYWQFRWLDMPVHLLAGAVVILGYQSISSFSIPYPKSLLTLVPSVFVFLCVAVAWEIFEYYKVLVYEPGYIEDTVIDIVLGLLGAFAGYYIAYSQKLYE